jgi:hypothetical protein
MDRTNASPSACCAGDGFSGKLAAIAWNAVHVARPSARLSGGLSAFEDSPSTPRRATDCSGVDMSPLVEDRSRIRPAVQSNAPAAIIARDMVGVIGGRGRTSALLLDTVLATALGRLRRGAQSMCNPHLYAL